MSREAMQQALQALELAKLNGKAGLYSGEVEEIAAAIAALRAALAGQQEPVTNAARRGSELSEGLGPTIEDAAYDCMSALAGVDTYDANLRDHPEAWAAVEAFAAKVRAAERERLSRAWQAAHGYDRNGVADWICRA